MTTTTRAIIQWRFLQPLHVLTSPSTTSHHRPCRIVFAGPHFQAGLQFTKELLLERNIPESKLQVIHAPTQEELMIQAPTADVAIPFMQHFNNDFIQQATNLRLIMQFGVGLERVAVETARTNGIAVSNIPASDTGNAQATAEHALLLALTLLRHGLQSRFQSKILGGLPPPRSLYQKNVTVVGFGAVGQCICHYLSTMGADVTAVRQRKWTEIDDQNDNISMKVCKANSLASALPTSDLVILACTMTPETWHLMNEETIALLPDGALLINVGRGPLVKHSAVLKALESGKLGGFASDVGVGHDEKDSEPWDPEDVLSKHPNALFTPHVGGYSDVSYRSMAHFVVDAIENVIIGKPPAIWVNKDGM